MKILIADDDFMSRNLLLEVLKDYGTIHIAADGKEAVEAVRVAMATGEPYKLICLDIMMPKMDGQQALRQIRDLEEAEGITSTNGAKIFMTTALGDPKNAITSFKSLCDGYVVKPIDVDKLYRELRRNKLIK